jgi:transposase
MYVGFDVSKETVDYAFREATNQWTCKRIDNKNDAFMELKMSIPFDSHCVMEATGPYYLSLAYFLHSSGYKVSVINPLVIKRYSQMKMKRTKTDKADSKIIAEYAKEQSLEIWTPSEKTITQIQQINSMLEKLIEQRTAWKNKKESHDKNPEKEAYAERIIVETIKYFNSKIEEIEGEIENIINDNFSKENQILRSIPGIGPKTSSVLIVITGCFKKFGNYKQLISYVGLAPRIYDSGKSIRGKSHICKMGMKRIRQLLYMCAWTAKEVNLACKNLFDRLIAKGKSKKVALIAVANKLLRQAFALMKKNEKYNPLFS